MAQESDSGYKDIFSHPEMVRDLLIQFIGGEWLKQVDFTTLERVNASYVSDRGDARHDDMVWKVRLAGDWLYLYVLLEFQSQSDRWMALRLLVYVGLLYQDLVKAGELSPQDKLPPVLPVVLYNGTQRWTAATDLTQLVLPPPKGLERWQPAQRYLLIDENALDINALDPQTNLVTALFRLEQSRTPEDLRRIVVSFDRWLGATEQAPLRQSLKRWVLRLLRRKLRSDSIPEIADLLEVDSMLAERIESWADEWERQGRLAGEAQILRRQLERRFGTLPEWVGTKLLQATEEELMCWAERIFDAETLDRLFMR